MPTPCGLHYLFQARKLRLPAKLSDRFLSGGYQARRIARTPGFLNGLDAHASNVLAHFDDFAHRIAVAVAQVKKALFAWRQGQDMSLRQVSDMDVVANACAVRRRIVGPENIALGCQAHRHFQHVGNQMRLNLMVLAKMFRRACGIEVTESHKFQAMNLMIPTQHLLKHQLGLAVRVDWPLGQIFGHGDAVRWPVGGAR